MRILFLDQTGNLGGAELSLIDIARPYRESCLVGLFADGPFKLLLEQQGFPVKVFATRPIKVRTNSSLVTGLGSLGPLMPLVARVARLSHNFDLIYANTAKAFVVGALASFFSRRPLVYHLQDIISANHYSAINRRVAVALANRFATRVIANSKATQTAFVEAGGRPEITEVIYYSFKPEIFQSHDSTRRQTRGQLGLDEKFIVGHFSRLSPWKGQEVLIEALVHCPEEVVAIFVGDALFGEQDYVQQLHRQVARLQLEDRVRFLGFRDNVVPLMVACDLVAHTSTAPEPFGRVIIEAMLCGSPLITTQDGGPVEMVEAGRTGWLVPPGDPVQLAAAINTCRSQPERTAIIAQQAQREAAQRYNPKRINQKIAQLLNQVIQASQASGSPKA